MIAKYNGTCVYCKKPTKAGVDHYDLDLKDGYHLACKADAEENPKPTPEQLQLAEKLGYRPHAEWHVLLLPEAAHGDPTWWTRS